jgi:hypothetical protein
MQEKAGYDVFLKITTFDTKKKIRTFFTGIVFRLQQKVICA